MEGRTFEFSFPLPGSAQRNNKGSKTAGPRKNAPKTRKTRKNRKNRKAGTSGSPRPENRVHQPNGNNTSRETPSTKANGTRQDRREYGQARNKTPERMEYNRRLAQEQHRKAKESGKCRNCPAPAITGHHGPDPLLHMRRGPPAVPQAQRRQAEGRGHGGTGGGRIDHIAACLRSMGTNRLESIQGRH